MAHPSTLRTHAKSLLKRSLISQKQHDKMMAKIEAMAPDPAPSAAPADPALDGASNLPSAATVPVTASVPGGPQNGSPVPAQQPPAA